MTKLRETTSHSHIFQNRCYQKFLKLHSNTTSLGSIFNKATGQYQGIKVSQRMLDLLWKYGSNLSLQVHAS